MKIEMTEDGLVRCSQSIAPYSEIPQCPACGFKQDMWWRRWLRALRGKKQKTVVEYRFCPGSKPPSEERPFNIFALYGDREVTNKCSGIELPHLHAHCAHCHAEWYCDTKEAM